MKTILEIIHIVISTLLIVMIFLQATGENDQKSNLLATNSGKRGWDKILFNLTIFTLVLFVISSVVQVVLK